MKPGSQIDYPQKFELKKRFFVDLSSILISLFFYLVCPNENVRLLNWLVLKIPSRLHEFVKHLARFYQNFHYEIHQGFCYEF